MASGVAERTSPWCTKSVIHRSVTGWGGTFWASCASRSSARRARCGCTSATVPPLGTSEVWNDSQLATELARFSSGEREGWKLRGHRVVIT